MEKLTLYKYESPDIKILMEIYFSDKNQLIFDGYDIGKTVEKLTGDSDYEYSYTIEFSEVKKIADIFGLDSKNRLSLLAEIKKRFNGADAYSKLGNFMKKNGVAFSQFMWR